MANSRKSKIDFPDAKRRYLDPYVPGMGRVTTWSESYRAAVEAFLSVSFAGWLSIAK